MRFIKTASFRNVYALRHEPEVEKILGEWYWSLLLVMLGIIVGGSITFGVLEFMRPLATEDAASVSVGDRKNLTRPDFVKILEVFDARAQDYELRRTAPVPVKDPS